MRNSNGFFAPPFCMAARYGSCDGFAGCGRKAYIQKEMGKQYGKSAHAEDMEGNDGKSSADGSVACMGQAEGVAVF